MCCLDTVWLQTKLTRQFSQQSEFRHSNFLTQLMRLSQSKNLIKKNKWIFMSNKRKRIYLMVTIPPIQPNANRLICFKKNEKTWQLALVYCLFPFENIIFLLVLWISMLRRMKNISHITKTRVNIICSVSRRKSCHSCLF